MIHFVDTKVTVTLRCILIQSNFFGQKMHSMNYDVAYAGLVSVNISLCTCRHFASLLNSESTELIPHETKFLVINEFQCTRSQKTDDRWFPLCRKDINVMKECQTLKI